MIEVTEKAADKLKEYFRERQIDVAPIRIFFSNIG
jgi:Fe-S cluster assembly iron-binding protein IscA